MEAPDTLREAIIWFAEFENCRQFMVALRWPDGKVKCPRCGSEHVFYIEKERVWKCYGKHPLAKFSLKTWTIFEDSPIPLEKWLPATWLIVNCKNGISSYELSRDLEITQKSCWFMLHRIRLGMQSGTFQKLSGHVEVDETFIGAKARNMHADVKARKIQGRRGPEGKAIVAAVLERGGKVHAKVIDKRRKKQLQAIVRENVEPKSAVYSDALKSYDGLSEEYAHQVIDHAIEYVRENGFRCQLDEQQFLDCRSRVEALWNEKYTSAIFSSAPERAEVGRHRADIVRNEHSPLFRRQRQNLGISHAA